MSVSMSMRIGILVSMFAITRCSDRWADCTHKVTKKHHKVQPNKVGVTEKCQWSKRLGKYRTKSTTPAQANVKAENTTPRTPKTVLAMTTCASLLVLVAADAVPLLVALVPDPLEALVPELVGAPANPV
jgi:hypothetical protein